MEAQRATTTKSDIDIPSRLEGFLAVPNISNFMPHRGLHWGKIVRDETKLEKWIVRIVIGRGIDPPA